MGQVTRVSGTTLFLRHQPSGQTKKVHRSKVCIVDLDMTWESIASIPQGKQHRGGPQPVKVNIQVHTPSMPLDAPCRDPLAKGNLHVPQIPQPSTSNDSMDVEEGDLTLEHYHTWSGHDAIPVCVPEVPVGLDQNEPITVQLPASPEPMRGRRRNRKVSVRFPQTAENWKRHLDWCLKCLLSPE